MTGELAKKEPGGSPFDAIRKTDAQGEFWSGRELGDVLSYKDWRNFMEAVEKAKVSCEIAGHEPGDHFGDATKMIQIGKGAERSVNDVRLSRYACYIVAMNGDPRKAQVAAAQRYFAIQTYRAETHLSPVANESDDPMIVSLQRVLEIRRSQLALEREQAELRVRQETLEAEQAELSAKMSDTAAVVTCCAGRVELVEERAERLLDLVMHKAAPTTKHTGPHPSRVALVHILDTPALLKTVLEVAPNYNGIQRALARASGCANSTVGKILGERGLVATRDGRLVKKPLPDAGRTEGGDK
ncbi:MAG: hypothetical protein C0467_25315 [Planctomycetaceae bacterium]|nr:hypothetical protein [Planctomycetaceae bacterium]